MIRLCRLVFLLFVGLATTPQVLAVDLNNSDIEQVAVDYETVTVQRFFDATVEAVNQSTIAAQVSEQIVAINFDVDDYVEKGTVLIAFKNTQQKARLDKAQALLREAIVARKDAQTELERIQDIYARKLVAKAALDKANAAFKAAQARQSQAEAGLKEAQQEFEKTVVRAPYSGIVIARHIELGETPRIGDALMTGLALNQLRVTANVPQQFISVLRGGCCPARIMIPGQLQQQVSTQNLTVYPIADKASHSFKIRVDLEEGQHGLYPGMFVKLVLDVDTGQRLMLPVEALVVRGEVTGVYVIDKGRISFRYVKTGRRYTDGRIEIHAGLEPGETVAIDPEKAVVRLKEQAS